MTEIEARQHLLHMLDSFTPGSVLHLLAQVLRKSEELRRGGLDEAARERVGQTEAALVVMGLGVDAACPR